MDRDAALFQSIAHTQNIAQKIGANTMAVEVYGWAIKHAMEIPAPAFRELMDMITGDK